MTLDMLCEALLERILSAIPGMTIGILGDLFLDRYLDLDARLTEPSLETGLDAYQVERVRSLPGAAGTVINNLAALGVKTILPIALIGDDGEGYELRQSLSALRVVSLDGILPWHGRRTPTYTKPMLCEPGQVPRELNRIDIKNRTPLPTQAEDKILGALEDIESRVDALLVLDQVSEVDCGVVTKRIRQRLAELGSASPERIILVDSRERIHLFRSVWIKPNGRECLTATGDTDVVRAIKTMAAQTGRPVVCTLGDEGMVTVDPRRTPPLTTTIPAYAVSGPIDPVGAGDSSTAALACALVAGATLEESCAFAALIASITIQQIGTTGTATPDMVRTRWRQVGP